MTEWARVARHRQPWLEDDIKTLQAALRDDATTIPEIARRMGRKREAVSTMARKVMHESLASISR
jgi:predicted transcriptional regulator